MGASVQPVRDPRVERNVQRMRAAGKSQSEISAYQAYEAQQAAPAAAGQRPAAAPGFAAESTAAIPRPPDTRTPAEQTGVPDSPHSGSRGSILNSITNGMSGGFADEVLPVAGWLGESAARLVTGSKPRGFKESTTGMREDLRGQNRAYAADHPGRNMAGELAGGVAGAVAGGGGLFGPARAALAGRLGAGAGRAALTSAAEGGAAGAVTGAGAADGGPGQRLAGAAVGGTLGALSGGTLTGSSRLFGSARNILGARSGKAAVNKADELILRNLERDGVSLADLTGTHTTASAAGAGAKPRMLLDAAGGNTQGLAETVATIPSRGKETVARALTERQRGQQGRISTDLIDFLRMGDEDALDVTEKLIAGKRTAAKDAYNAAYARGQVDVPEVVQAIEEVPQFRRAYAAGRNLMRLEDGRTLPPLYETTVVGGEKVKTLRPLTVEMVDAMKQGLDEVIGAGMRAGTMGKKTARLLRNRLRSTLQAVDVAAPEYAAARAQFAGDVALEKAVAAGEKVLQTDPRVVEKAVASMTDGEKEMFRIGALKALRRNMGKAAPGRDVTSRVAGESAAPERERLLRAIAPDEDSFQKLRDLVTSEAKMADAKRQVLGNSATARRVAGQADMLGFNAGEAAGTGMDLASGNVLGLARRGVGAALSARAQGVAGNVADELGDRLTLQPGTDAFGKYLQQLQTAHEQQLRRALAGQAGTRAIGATVGQSWQP